MCPVRKAVKYFLILLLLLSAAVLLPADSQSVIKGAPDRNFRITPLAGPAYTPELGFMLAGGIMMSLSTDPGNPGVKRSSFPVNLGLSSTGAYFANSRLASYWLDDFLRIHGDFYFKDMPDHYYGVGYDVNSSTVQGDETTAYRRFWWEVKPEVLFRLRDSLYTGFLWNLNQTVISGKSETVAADPFIISFGDNNLNHGIGFILQYDSRDVPVNAWEGVFVDGRTSFFIEALGSDNQYEVYELDYRQYEQILRKGSTLAWQIKGRFTKGDVPYNELSQPGTPFDLRGYYWGHYRDRHMALGLMEYRYMFRKRDGSLSHHGIDLWTGAGVLGDEESRISPLLWNAGFGYRLQVQPRMNLRIDFGFGRDSFGFYFNFNEVF